MFMAPVVEELASEYEGKIKFARVDIDANPNTAQQLGIMSIPTFLVTNRGKVLDVLIGAMGKKDFEDAITQYIEK